VNVNTNINTGAKQMKKTSNAFGKIGILSGILSLVSVVVMFATSGVKFMGFRKEVGSIPVLAVISLLGWVVVTIEIFIFLSATYALVFGTYRAVKSLASRRNR
jgi:hypothetical protein